jgi:hypothetical protein
MKYYIVGKSENFTATKEKDTDSLEKYWELGWEIGVSRVAIIQKLLNNEISNEDTTVVTLKDRMFMYQSIFKNVISYEDFINLNHSDIEIVTSLSEHDYMIENHMYPVDMSNTKLIEKILDTKKEVITENLSKPFFMIHYRERPWCNYRNISHDDYIRIIEKINSLGFDFFVYGKNSESIGKKYNKKELTLSEANTYLSHDNCVGVIGPLSGGTMISVLSCKKTHHVLDVGFQNRNDHPLYHGIATNFIGANIINYNFVDDFIKNV